MVEKPVVEGQPARESVYESDHYCLNIEARPKKDTDGPFTTLHSGDEDDDYFEQDVLTAPVNDKTEENTISEEPASKGSVTGTPNPFHN